MKRIVFTCEKCRKTFTSAWTTEESEAEAKELFGEVPDRHARGFLCDECYDEFKIWWDALPEDENQKR